MISTTPAQARYTTFSCPNPDCTQFNRSNVDTIVHRSWTGKHQHIERLRCTACDHEFSEREGTLMARSKLAEDKVERLLKCQRCGVCDEGTADICEVDLKTVSLPAGGGSACPDPSPAGGPGRRRSRCAVG